MTKCKGNMAEVAAQLEAVNDNLERIADNLDSIHALATIENLKVIGRAITIFLDGLLDKAEITNGTEGKD